MAGQAGQAGTFVSEQIHPQQSAVDVVAFAGESQQPLPFQMGLPALDLFRVNCGRG